MFHFILCSFWKAVHNKVEVILWIVPCIAHKKKAAWFESDNILHVICNTCFDLSINNNTTNCEIPFKIRKLHCDKQITRTNCMSYCEIYNCD